MLKKGEICEQSRMKGQGKEEERAENENKNELPGRQELSSVVLRRKRIERRCREERSSVVEEYGGSGRGCCSLTTSIQEETVLCSTRNQRVFCILCTEGNVVRLQHPVKVFLLAIILNGVSE